MPGSFDDLDGAVGTLNFASSANQAIIKVYNNRFPFFDLKDIYRAGVNACSFSIAFLDINLNFYHGRFNSTFLDSNEMKSSA